MKRMVSLLFLMLLFVVFDFQTKMMIKEKFFEGETLPIINGYFNLTYVKNTGAAWGFGQSFSGWLRISSLLVLPVLICLYLVVWLKKTITGPLHLSLAITFILTGAIGNLIDRFSQGYVVDFLDFYYQQHHFEAFNVADSCVTVGAILLAYEFLIAEPRRKKSHVTKH